jgi:hypothetical protein
VDEQEATGSQTGWTSIKGDGTGPSRQTDGTVLVNAWCNDNQTSENPKQVVWDLRKEIERIVLNNVESTQYQYLSIGNITKMVEDSQDPVMHRYEIPVGYQYEQEAVI